MELCIKIVKIRTDEIPDMARLGVGIGYSPPPPPAGPGTGANLNNSYSGLHACLRFGPREFLPLTRQSTFASNSAVRLRLHAHQHFLDFFLAPC
jgi:hypothetical protein